MAWSKAARLAAARSRKIASARKGRKPAKKGQIGESVRTLSSLANINKETALATAGGLKKTYDAVPLGGQIGQKGKPAAKLSSSSDVVDNVTAAATAKQKTKAKKKVAPRKKVRK